MRSYVLCLVALAGTSVAAFAPVIQRASHSQLFRHSSSSLQAMPLAAAAAVPNPFKKLPWNAKKEQEREARRLKLESAKLHRELGITEDATYEEIVAATDSLLKKAGDDLKAKIKIEVAKDKILQIRLNARLAGLATATKDARAQSNFEVEGADDEEPVGVKKQAQEWNAPQWMQGIVVKPDKAQVNRQLKIWGGMSMLGLFFPPAIEKMQLFNWMVCVGQLIFRGMPISEAGGGGFGAFAGGSGGSHKKVAWLIGLTLWLTAKILIWGLMPSSLRGLRYTPTIAFATENTIFGLAACYLQPYKG